MSKLRRVSTAFLQDPQTKYILLLQRSDKVNTFQHHWAGISGSIEIGENSLQCITREIQEELSIKPNQFSLIRSGRPLKVPNAKYDSTFVVHPFLFRLEGSPQITIDWEHQQYKFIPSDSIRSYTTVPNLEETFERVTIDDTINQAALDSISNNKTDGAAGLTREAVTALMSFAERHSQVKGILNYSQNCQELAAKEKGEEFQYKFFLITTLNITLHPFLVRLKNFAWHLMHIRYSMAPIANAVVLALAEPLKQAQSVESFVADLRKSTTTLLENQPKATTAIVQNFRTEFSGSSVLTHSYSGTVSKALKNLSVYVTESRPLNEGINTAKLLQNAGCNVTLLTDANATNVIVNQKKVQACVVGADSILNDGSVVNKTGTFTISLACQEAKIPLYVLCDTLKIRPKPIEELEKIEWEEGPRKEVVDSNVPDTIGVLNPVFEVTAAAAHICIISEIGMLTQKTIADIAKDIYQKRQLVTDD